MKILKIFNLILLSWEFFLEKNINWDYIIFFIDFIKNNQIIICKMNFS